MPPVDRVREIFACKEKGPFLDSPAPPAVRYRDNATRVFKS